MHCSACPQRPGLLDKRADVRFALKCQAFIELVKKGELSAAVAFAQVRRISRVRVMSHFFSFLWSSWPLVLRLVIDEFGTPDGTN